LTEYATRYPCPNGTFSNRTTLSDVGMCEPCVGGQYCETDGLSAPTAECDRGFFCGRGARTAAPAGGFEEVYNGDTCTDQIDTGANGVCPRGHYCPKGSPAPIKCPPGLMNAAQGMFNLSHCEDCTAGYFCNISATITPVEKCLQGFYCPGGDAVPTFECPLGHYCPGFNAVPLPCAAGTFQNTTAQAMCLDCPPGKFCELATVTPASCPVGFYCLASTEYATQHPCPNGTFSNRTELKDVQQCSQCTAGTYCEAEGLFKPTGLCEAGFFCNRGSNTATPGDGGQEVYKGETCAGQSDEEENGVCPVGHFCPEGSGSPEQCPPGTMSSARGLHNVTECMLCEAGFYCPESATVNATLPCEPGFYCPEGTATPSLLCTLGHYCPGGDIVPIACVAGTFTNTTAQPICRDCPAGYYCEEAQIMPVSSPFECASFASSFTLSNFQK
jgi:hypothetical protein